MLRFNAYSQMLKALFAWEEIAYFWRFYPALYYALWALIGVYTSLSPHSALLIPVLFLLTLPLLFPLLQRSASRDCVPKLLLGVITALLFFVYAEILYQFPQLPEEGVQGVVHFTPTNLRVVPSRLGVSWRIEGTLHCFFPTGSQEERKFFIKRARFRMDLPYASKNVLPVGSKLYYIQGRLSGQAGSYFFKAAKNTLWHILDEASSFTHMRYFSKQWVEKTIHDAFTDTQVAALLTGLFTGEVSDRQIASTLMRFGLLHIMAVSGLHFSLLIAFLSPFFRCFFSLKWSKLPLLCALSGYVAFLGPNPSVLRAFSAIFLSSIGYMLSRSSSGCNLLGLSLLLFLLYEPSIALLLSFQMTFLATASILILYRPFLALVSQVLRCLPVESLLKAQKRDQCAAIVLTVLRSSCALTLAVHSAMVPVSLYFFGYFPYMSLFYNLFFPSLIGVSLILLLLGLTVQVVVAPFGMFIHSVNEIYTRLVFNTVVHMPPYWDRTALRASPSCLFLMLFLTLLFLFAMHAEHKIKDKEEEENFYET